MFRVFDFEEGMRMIRRSFTFLAKIKIITNSTFVSDANNVLHSTSITDNVVVKRLGFVFLNS